MGKFVENAGLIFGNGSDSGGKREVIGREIDKIIWVERDMLQFGE